MMLAPPLLRLISMCLSNVYGIISKGPPVSPYPDRRRLGTLGPRISGYKRLSLSAPRSGSVQCLPKSGGDLAAATTEVEALCVTNTGVC
ncbi:Os12g0564932 [Oryza sativa Japonica Group]|uniref:Os12g0564932 protein n=1 Tax=Oryza sativa subsp. japonica TaxID=39947 RepID=A0A0P0YBD9_ORYSJ|nr:hypothetical protein EE612_060312 [Oryza sativa]BAT17681.1 Os12g0564932 [Oryza sativa Japonica Group]